MPAAIDRNCLSLVRRLPVLVANIMNAGDGRATALTIKEVDRLPDAFPPGIVTNRKRFGRDFAGFETVGARLIEGRKIQKQKIADRGFDRADLVREDHPSLFAI